MNHPAFVPLRNTSLPHAFRYIRLERARDHDHPEGDSKTAYIMIAPLDAQSRIDVEAWREHKEACRVVRKRPGGDDNLGHLVHGPGGSWRFHYDVLGPRPTNPATISVTRSSIRANISRSAKPTA